MSSGLNYESIAQRIQAYSMVEEVEVQFDLDDSLIEFYVGDFIDALATKLTLQVSIEEIEDVRALLLSYLSVLLMMRIDYVNSVRIAKRPKDNDLCIPRMFSNVLEQIGKVDAVNFGITLKPVLVSNRSAIWDKAVQALPLRPCYQAQKWGSESKESPEFSAPSLEAQAHWINDATNRLKRVFFQTQVKPSPCLPVSTNGTLDFMVLQCKDQVVYANRNNISPLFALFAAVVGVHQKAGVFFPSINYGSFSQMRETVRLVTKMDADCKEGKDVNSGSSAS